MSADELNEQESSPDSNGSNSTSADEAEKLNSAVDSNFSYKNDSAPKGSLRSVFGRFKKSKGKAGRRYRNWAIGVAGGSFIAIVVMILFILTSLKLPNLAAHVVAYNMTRVFRDFGKSAEDASAESLGKDVETAAGDSLIGRLKTSYGDLRSSTWGKLDVVRPAKILENLESTGRLQYVYDEVPRTILPGTKLVPKAYILDGARVDLPEQSFGKFFSNSSNRIQFNGELTTALEQATPETFGMIRSKVMGEMLDRFGIKLYLWEKLASKFKGMTQEEAYAAEAQSEYQRVKQPPTENSTISEINQEADKAAAEVDQKVASGEAEEVQLSRVRQAAQDVRAQVKDFHDTVKLSIDNALSETTKSILLKGLEFFNGFYRIAFPVCLIYDGSVVKSGPQIDAKSTALQRIGYMDLSGSDQTKVGDTVAPARGAKDLQLGDITESVPERRARGEIVDTSQVVTGPNRPQAGGNGNLSTDTNSIITAYFGHNAVTDNLDKVIEKVCPVITSPGGIVASFAAQIGLTFLSGGTDAAAETAAAEGVSTAATEIAGEAGATAAAQIAGNEILSNVVQATFAQKMKGFVLRVGIETVAIGGLTLLAKLAVLSHMNSTYTGIDQGSDQATQTDMGINLNANESERQIMMGRTMTTAEVADNRGMDQQYLANKKAQMSIYDRYVSLSNPDSLLTNVGSWIQGKMSFFRNPNRVAGNILHLFSSLPNAFANAFRFSSPNRVLAATPDANYGIMQWGWSSEENGLIARADGAYAPLENAEYWAHRVDPKVQSDIESKYGKCFTSTIGTLLSDGSIKRDQEGTIDESSDCSPSNLGPHNSKYGDLVFRWRLLKRNETVIDHLLDIQNVQDSPASTGGQPTT